MLSKQFVKKLYDLAQGARLTFVPTAKVILREGIVRMADVHETNFGQLFAHSPSLAKNFIELCDENERLRKENERLKTQVQALCSEEALKVAELQLKAKSLEEV